MYVRFIWQVEEGGLLGPDGDPFEPSERAAHPSDDAIGAWHPFATGPRSAPGMGLCLYWRRCLQIVDYDCYVEEFNNYTLKQAQPKDDT